MTILAGTSEVTIARMALSHLGTRTQIEDFDEDSTEAGEIRIWYEHSRLETLEKFDWSFARKRIVAAQDGDEPPETTDGSDIWAYRYQYPSDCVKVRQIQNPSSRDNDAIPFEIETNSSGVKTVITNEPDAVLVYTRNAENADQFSATFVTALSYLIAARICVAITGDDSKRNSLFELWRIEGEAAEAADANEEVSHPPRDADWIRAMHGDGFDVVPGRQWTAFPDGDN